MKVVVGLGNPGREYEMTRHNLGFLLIDRLFDRTGGQRFREEAQAAVATIEWAGARLLLVKPLTYMNLSGNAVRPLLDKYGEAPTPNDASGVAQKAAASLLVVCDDIALPFGMLRIRPRGSAGGQKGLQSIIERAGTQDFPRLRLGIKPPHPVSSVSDFVLAKIPKRDVEMLEKTLDRAIDAIEVIIRDGVERAMSLFNERVKEVTSDGTSSVTSDQ